MVNFKASLIIITLILFFKPYLGTEARSLKFIAGRSNFNSKYFKNFTIYIRNNQLYVQANLIKILVSGIKANVTFQIRLANSKNYQTLFGYNFDVCNMAISYKDTLYKRWLNSLLKHGNFVQSCPVNEGHYYLNAWRMEPSLIPTFLYPGDYRANSYFYAGKTNNRRKDFIFNASIDATIIDN